MKTYQKIASPISLLLITTWEGAYIGHPMYENTKKPNNLANLKD